MSVPLKLAAALIACLAPVLRAAPVEILPAELRGAVQPQVAVAPSGRVHVVFGMENAIYHTMSPDGRVFHAPVKIGELRKLALRMRRGPRLTATDRLVLVTAISHADGNVHTWTSADDGGTWKEGAPLNTAEGSAREGLHSLAGDGAGLAVAVWLDHRSRGTEVWSRVSRDGGITWQRDTRVYASPDGHVCECCLPGVAISPEGGIAAMWRNWLGGSRDMWLAVSRDGGATFVDAQKLGSGTWKLNACPMDGGALAFPATGGPVAVWRRASAVYASLEFQAEQWLADAAAQPVIAQHGSTAIMLWEHSGGLMIRRGTGSPTRFAEKARAPSIAANPGRGAVVVWESSLTEPSTILAEAVTN